MTNSGAKCKGSSSDHQKQLDDCSSFGVHYHVVCFDASRGLDPV